MRHAVDHGFARAILHLGSVHCQPHRQVLRIGNFVFCDQPRTDLAIIVTGFFLWSNCPLFPVETRVQTRHWSRRSLLRNPVHLPQDTYFARLPITTASSTSQSVFSEPRGMMIGSIWTTDCAGRFHEYHWFRRYIHSTFFRVVSIVQPDADKFASFSNASAQPGVRADHGQID